MPKRNYSLWTKSIAPKFTDFPSPDVFKGAAAKVDLRSHVLAMMYRTQLRNQAPKGPNFAGHFTIAEWGCGSNCQAHMIIDAITGKVYEGVSTDRGIVTKVDSLLFIADPPDEPHPGYIPDRSYTPAWLPVRYYVWHDYALIKIFEQPCHIVNGEYQCVAGKPIKSNP
jgi:hypothetical protein